MRRYLKKHQVPFNGFAWDHPLRALWRALGNLDPILSQHTGWLAFLWENGPILLLVNGAIAVGSICAVLLAIAVTTAPHQHLTIASNLLIPAGLPSLAGSGGVLIILLRSWGERRNAAGIFLAAMEEIREALRTSAIEVLASCTSEAVLEGRARLALILDAKKHLRTEKQFLPGCPEREETRAIFSRHFDLFKKYNLIPQEETWLPFFGKAKR